METGFSNLHDEELFSAVFSREDIQLVNDNSIFDSLVDFSIEENINQTDFCLNPVKTETKEDYQRTLLDWQEHISSLQPTTGPTNIPISLLSSPRYPEQNEPTPKFIRPGDEDTEAVESLLDCDLYPTLLQDVSSWPGEEPAEEPALPAVSTHQPSYQVANRNGLVLKITKKKDSDDCDTTYVNTTYIKEEEVEVGGSDESPSVLVLPSPPDFSWVQIKKEEEEEEKDPHATLDQDLTVPASLESQHVKLEPQDLQEASSQQTPVQIEPSQSKKYTKPAKKPKRDKSSYKKCSSTNNNNSDISDKTLPRIKIEEIDYFSIQSEILESESATTDPKDSVLTVPNGGEAGVSEDSSTTHAERAVKVEEETEDWEADRSGGGGGAVVPESWDSQKKDSGLESGDVSDSSEPKSSPHSLNHSVQSQTSLEPGEIVEEEPIKKKLNLEEYRKRRKNATLKSPLKRSSSGWKIPTVNVASSESDAKKTGEKSEGKTQVEMREPKSLPDERSSDTRRRRSSRRADRAPPRASSSSSSGSRSSYVRRSQSSRGRSKRRCYPTRSHSRSRNRSRSKSRYRNRSRTKSRSWNRSRSKSRSRNTSRSKSRSRNRSRSKSRTRNRSRSKSRSRNRSLSKSRSRNRSRSKSRSRNRSRSNSRSRNRSRTISRSRNRSRSGSSAYSNSSRNSDGSRKRRRRRRYSRSGSRRWRADERWKRRSPSPLLEKQRQVEERRVIYVGRLEEGTTRTQLRERFSMFGPIVDISLHFREKGDNYGFVTFAYKGDAYNAVERGNDVPFQPKYDICFGGRRAFCQQRYLDLDVSRSPTQAYSPHQHNLRAGDSFDKLLREAQKKLKKANHV